MSSLTIDPSLSVYALVDHTTQERALLTHRRTMSVISHEIENVVLQDKVRARVFSSFQRMSRFLPQLERYRQLARTAEHVYVFGFPDLKPPPITNLTYVPLPPDAQLAREWFLVAEAPDYFSALATEELTSINDPDDKRLFRGVWSFDEAMVTTLQEWLSHLVGAPPLDAGANRNYRRHAQLLAHTMARMTMQVNRAVSQPETAAVLYEVGQVVQTQLAPALGGNG
jgi:DICT domain-containing protein